MSKVKTKKPHSSEELLETIDLWSVECNGANLIIDPPYILSTVVPIVIDVETDEKDNFVGIGVTQNGKDVYYYTSLRDDVKIMLENTQLIGHNVKGDLKWLKSWGVNVKPSQLQYDTILASYVLNTTKESHSLKNLASDYIDLHWPKYKDIVGTPGNKITLDKQPVELVANYCGMDCLATYNLWKYFSKTLTTKENKYLEEIELPTVRVLMEMELEGMKLDLNHLKELDDQFKFEIEQLSKRINDEWEERKFTKELNINSKKQIADLIEANGVVLPKTRKGNKKTNKSTLAEYSHIEVVQNLLEYSKINKLRSTYTKGLLEGQVKGKIHGSFNQLSRDEKGNSVGIGTGRLSSSNPNLQNIPTKTEEGKQIRQAFVASEGNLLVDFDFSQIEPRLVAHITKDPTFVNAFNEDKDIYQELVDGTGRGRDDGKTFMLALIYGALAKKLASVFQCNEDQAKVIIDSIMNKLPKVKDWIEITKRKAKFNKYIETLWGRKIPLPKINTENKWERYHWERVAVNSVVQGSAAEIMKKSLIALRKAGYLPILTVHDSFMFDVPREIVEGVVENVKSILKNIVKLNVPLKVSVGVGNNWRECKENETKD